MLDLLTFIHLFIYPVILGGFAVAAIAFAVARSYIACGFAVILTAIMLALTFVTHMNYQGYLA
jgi:hypothetical protein